jgi:hypothetical protein
MFVNHFVKIVGVYVQNTITIRPPLTQKSKFYKIEINEHPKNSYLANNKFYIDTP